IIDSLPDLYATSIEPDPHGRGYSIKYDPANPFDIDLKMALIIGDAIHGLKTALDYAWIAVSRADPANRHAKFPVRSSAAELESTLRGAQIHVSNPVLFERMIADVKPYRGGHWHIWALHELDI